MWLFPLSDFEKPTRKSLHLGRLYFCSYKIVLKRANASISKVRISMTSIAFCILLYLARLLFLLRLEDSHPVIRCSIFKLEV